MKYIFKLTFGLYIVINLVTSGEARFEEVMLFLLIAALDIYSIKYNDSVWVMGLECVFIGIASVIAPVFSILFGITVFDLMHKKAYWGLIPVAVAGIYLSGNENYKTFIFVMVLCVVYGFQNSQLEEKENLFRSMYDRERQYRYELEETKQKLLNSAKEAAHLAETKERNRIAREIHDNLGHSIAGILMQLQAVMKLFSRDNGKALELLQNSVEHLSESLTLLRNTVHNIKPRETLGVEYIESIVNKFSFCDIELKHSGDFNSISAEKMEVLSTNIKEALTNISKYSRATRVDICIDINERYIRLYIKDNGVGCTEIREGLGISGMKERIRNLGGSVSISGDDGFLVVCLIPNTREGSGIFENSYS